MKVTNKKGALKNKHIVLTSGNYHSFYDGETIQINIKKNNWSQLFYNQYNLEAESQKKITVEFLLQSHKFILRIIKNIDVLLKVGGELDLVLLDNRSHSKSYRSISQIKHAISISTNGRYICSSFKSDGLVATLSYLKKSATLLSNDLVNRWSFGIVSNGVKNNWVLEQIKSILDQNIADFEIIICGPSPFEGGVHFNDRVKIINDFKLEEDIRAPISHKKNLIIKEAQYNNLCIMHDRIILPKSWFNNLKKYGNYFDILSLRIVNQNNERILVDWMTFCSPLASLYRRNRALMYDEWDDEVIVPGAVFIAKKNLIEGFMFDERLYWDEMEDIYFSKIAHLRGLLIDIDCGNHFITKEVRQFSQSSGWVNLKIFSIILWIKSVVLISLRLKRSKKRYYKSYEL